MKTATEKFNERLAELGKTPDDLICHRIAIVCDNGIHLLENPVDAPEFNPYEKVYPSFDTLRSNTDFFMAVARHYTEENHSDDLVALCEWFFGVVADCPIDPFDLFYIQGDFSVDTRVFFTDTADMDRAELENSITLLVESGYVLDASRLKCRRIIYTDGEYDSVNKDWKPCLITCDNGQVAVEYFEASEPIPLKRQVGLGGSCGYTLDYISVASLRHILDAMVKP